ncbi:MAG: hypothetical protein QNJ17_12885 [Desulfocapsaceae bacterium]|nr:hypothetical protein [Desulfocapsaceae bacterium]
MRKSAFIGLLLASLFCLDIFIGIYLGERHERFKSEQEILRLVVKELGSTDLVVATEARYTRHPSVSDGLVPFMDHPADIEHFPSGSFYHPVPSR